MLFFLFSVDWEMISTEEILHNMISALGKNPRAYPNSAPIKDRLTNNWPEGDKGWKCVGGGRNIPGYSSVKSAEIAISKNPHWEENSLGIAIVPFAYNDGSIFAVTETRFAILVKVEEIEAEESKEFYSAPDFLANELKLAKKADDENRKRRLRGIVFDVEDAYNALPEEKRGGVWDAQRIKNELNISI